MIIFSQVRFCLMLAKITTRSTPRRFRSHHIHLNALFVATIWPELSASAASVRTLGLIQAMRDHDWKISYFSPAKPRQATPLHGVSTYSCPIDDLQEFQNILSVISPDVVIFDRFISEGI